MRFIRTVLILIVLVVAGVLCYNYWTGNGWTLTPASGAPGVNADAARQGAADVAKTTVEKAGEAATKVESSLNEGALTAKIKAKMALDDSVKARTISVETTGSVVTLTGTVGSAAERERAVRLAKETTGVTSVVDRLEIRK